METMKPYKSDLKIPHFESEAEEAQWWFDNDELISAEFRKAAQEGRLGRGGIRRLFAERGIPFPEPETAATPIATKRESAA